LPKGTKKCEPSSGPGALKRHEKRTNIIAHRCGKDGVACQAQGVLPVYPPIVKLQETINTPSTLSSYNTLASLSFASLSASVNKILKLPLAEFPFCYDFLRDASYVHLIDLRSISASCRFESVINSKDLKEAILKTSNRNKTAPHRRSVAWIKNCSFSLRDPSEVWYQTWEEYHDAGLADCLKQDGQLKSHPLLCSVLESLDGESVKTEVLSHIEVELERRFFFKHEDSIAETATTASSAASSLASAHDGVSLSSHSASSLVASSDPKAWNLLMWNETPRSLFFSQDPLCQVQARGSLRAGFAHSFIRQAPHFLPFVNLCFDHTQQWYCIPGTDRSELVAIIRRLIRLDEGIKSGDKALDAADNESLNAAAGLLLDSGSFVLPLSQLQKSGIFPEVVSQENGAIAVGTGSMYYIVTGGSSAGCSLTINVADILSFYKTPLLVRELKARVHRFVRSWYLLRHLPATHFVMKVFTYDHLTEALEVFDAGWMIRFLIGQVLRLTRYLKFEHPLVDLLPHVQFTGDDSDLSGPLYNETSLGVENDTPTLDVLNECLNDLWDTLHYLVTPLSRSYADEVREKKASYMPKFQREKSLQAYQLIQDWKAASEYALNLSQQYLTSPNAWDLLRAFDVSPPPPSPSHSRSTAAKMRDIPPQPQLHANDDMCDTESNSAPLMESDASAANYTTQFYLNHKLASPVATRATTDSQLLMSPPLCFLTPQDQPTQSLYGRGEAQSSANCNRAIFQ